MEINNGVDLYLIIFLVKDVEKMRKKESFVT